MRGKASFFSQAGRFPHEFGDVNEANEQVRKRVSLFAMAFYTKYAIIILPRQARDRHRRKEHSKIDHAFSCRRGWRRRVLLTLLFSTALLLSCSEALLPTTQVISFALKWFYQDRLYLTGFLSRQALVCGGILQELIEAGIQVRNRVFLRHLIQNMIVLPSQARDKHRWKEHAKEREKEKEKERERCGYSFIHSFIHLFIHLFNRLF